MVRISKFLSLVVAGVYIYFGLQAGPYVIYVIMYLLLPMAAIWFSEPMGDYLGSFRMQSITATSPGWLVHIFGWLLLGAPVVLPPLGDWIGRPR